MRVGATSQETEQEASGITDRTGALNFSPTPEAEEANEWTNEEIQDEYYSVLFLDSGIAFFVGTEQCSWAKVAIPEGFLGSAVAAPGGTAW